MYCDLGPATAIKSFKGCGNRLPRIRSVDVEKLLGWYACCFGMNCAKGRNYLYATNGISLSSTDVRGAWALNIHKACLNKQTDLCILGLSSLLLTDSQCGWSVKRHVRRDRTGHKCPSVAVIDWSYPSIGRSHARIHILAFLEPYNSATTCHCTLRGYAEGYDTR